MTSSSDFGTPPQGSTPYAQPGQGWGQPGQGQGWGGAPTPQRRNGLGVAALVLGVLAVLTCWSVIGGIVLGLAAIVLGVLGRGRARRREADNGGVALAGLLLGLVGALLSGVLLAAGLSVFNSEEGQQLRDCLAGAGQDQAAVDRCAQQFEQTAQ